MNKIAMRACKLAAAVAVTLGTPTLALAATLSIDANSTTPGVQAAGTVQTGQSTGVDVVFIGDGTTSNVSGPIQYDTALFNVTSNNTACAVDDSIGIVAMASAFAAPPAAGSTNVICTLTFTAVGAAGTSTAINIVDAATTFADSPGGDTINDGTLAIVAAPAGPTAPTIALSPNPVNLPGGNVGTTQTATVTIDTPVDATGTGNATVACTAPAGFTTTQPVPNTFTTGSGTVTVGCTLGAAPTSGTLTCTATAGGGAPAGTQDATTTLNCPAGTAVPTSSEFNGNLSATLVGAPNSTATGSIAITNSGDGPLTITCGAPSAGFTVTQPPAASTPPGGSTSIGLSCTVPSGGATSGSLVCNTNDPDDGESVVTFALNCVAQAVAVPTMGGYAKGMLAAMLAAVGLLGFALRRKLV